MKLTKMFDYYLNQYVIDERITGISTAKSNIENLERFFKNKQIEKLTADDIDDYKTFRRRRSIKNATIRRELAVLKICLKLAVQKKYITEKFLEDLKIKLPKVEPRKVYPSQDEILLLLKSLPVYYRRLFFASWRLGLRPRSEMRKLKFKHINFEQGLLEIQHNNGDFRIKNKRSFSPILDDSMIIFFRNLEREAKRIFGDNILNQYVFRSRKNTKINKWAVYKSFRNAQIKNNMTDDNNKWLYRPHDFRKAAAKYLLHVKQLPQKYVCRYFTNHIDEETFTKYYDIDDNSDFDHAMSLMRQ
jgi:integrase